MRIVLLSFLFLLGITACGSIAKETAKGAVSSIVGDFDEYDLSTATEEALAVGQANGTSKFTYVGLALFALGAVSFAFFARDAGLKLIVCGALSGSVPYVVQSQYFSIIVNVSIAIVLLIGIWHFWWKVKQSETITNGEEQKP
jgi:hypothetical protein